MPATRMEKQALPLFTGDKETYVRDMFSQIAPRYDLLNSILSFNRHKAWRRLAVRLAGVKSGDCCLDVCSGTGDFAVDLARAAGTPGSVVGSDFCEPMIRSGLAKTVRAAGAPISMMVANAESLPYAADRFAVVTVGFGIRNVAHIDAAVREMARVAAPGGRVCILEFSRPRPCWYKAMVDFYLFRILPRIGGMLSRQEAYTYLPHSMKQFVSRDELARLMEAAGLCEVKVRDINLGTVCIHIGVKPVSAGSEATP